MTLRLHTELTADASGLRGEVKLSEQDLAQLRAEGTRAGAAVAAGAERMAAGSETAARGLRQASQASEAASRATRVYAQLQERLRRAVAAGAVTQEDANRALQAAHGQMEAGSRRLRAATSTQRRFGLAAQQSAFQVQDFFVQVQAGVPVMRSLSMQLPQLLGSFGVWGAVVGAAVAVSASLGGELLDLEDAGTRVADAQDALSDALDRSRDLLGESADEVLELARAYAAAGAAQRAFIRADFAIRMAETEQAIRDQIAAVRDLATETLQAAYIRRRSEELGSSVGPALGDMPELDDAQARRLTDALQAFAETPAIETLQSVAVTVAELQEEVDRASPALLDLASKFVGAARQAQTATDENERLAEVLAQLGEDAAAFAAQIAAGTSDAERALEGLRDKIGELNREALVLSGAMDPTEASLDAMAEGLAASGANAEEAAAALAVYERLLRQVAAQRAQAEADAAAEREAARAAQERARALEGLAQRTAALARESRALRGETSEVEAAVAAAAAALEDAGVAAEAAAPALAAFRAELEAKADAAEAAAAAQDRHNEQLRRASGLVESTRTPLERIAVELRELERTRAWIVSAEGAAALAEAGVSAEAALAGVNRRAAELRDEMAAAELELQPLGQAFRAFAGEVEDDFKEAFKQAFREGEGGFRRLMDSFEELFLDMLAELAFQALAKPVIVPVVQALGQSVFGLSPAQAQAGARQAGLPTGGLPGGGLFDLDFGNLSLTGSGGSRLGTDFVTGSVGRTLGLVAEVPVGAPVGGPGGPINLLPGRLAPTGFGSTIETGLNNLGNPLTAPAGFAANFAADLILGGDRGFGADIGGALGGIAGGAAFGPVGAAFGAFAGNALGGLFGFGKRKPSVGPNAEALGTLQGGLVSIDAAGADNGGDVRRATGLLGRLAQALQQVSAAAGRDVGAQQARIKVMEKSGEITVEAAGQVGVFGDEAEAVLFAVRALSGNFAGFDQEMERVVREAGSLQQALADLQAVAAIDGLRMFHGEATRLETQVRELAERTRALSEAAERLGLGEERRRRILEAQARELDAMRRNFEADIARQTLEIFNPGSAALAELQDAMVQTLREAGAVGADLVAVERLYGARRLQAVQAFSDAQLRALSGGTQLDRSLGAFETARRDIAAALEEVHRGFAGFADAAAAFVEGLDRLRGDLLVDARLSPLAPLDRRDEARRLLQETVAAARDGDAAALGDVERDMRGFLEVSRALFASGQPYQDDVAWALDLVEGLGAELGPGLDTAERQLSVLTEIRDLLALPLPDVGRLAALFEQAGLGAQFAPLLGNLADRQASAEREIGHSRRDATQEIYSLGLQRLRAEDASALPGWIAAAERLLAAGLIDREGLRKDAEDVRERGFEVPRFAAGGPHAGGLRLVGEAGPEIEATGPAQIFSAARVAEIFRRGQAAAAQEAAGTVPAVQALTRQVARLTGRVELLRAEVAGRRADAERQHGEAATAQRGLARSLEAAAGGQSAAGGWGRSG